MYKLVFVVILLISTAFLSSAMPVKAQSDIRFGAVEAYHAPAAASQAGIAWERVRFHWAEIQAGGQDSWNDGDFPDDVLGREIAAGRQVVGLLIGVPDWANEKGIPRGLNLPHTDPENTWAVFVRTITSRYAGRIDHWILWNEPDVWDSNHPGHTWHGSIQDFLQLNRVGYVTAKESNPNAVIHFSGMTYWWDAAYGRQPYFQRYLEELVADKNAAGNNFYFDVATLHLYFQPHYVYDITSYYYGIMSSFGIWKPIWIVETNAAPSMDPAWPVAEPRFNISLDEQAAYMPQALVMGMAAGAQRIGVYKLIDTPGDAAANPEPFGLIRANGSYRPAFTTFQVAARMLAGATRTVRNRWDDVGQVTVEQANGVTTVLFTRVPGVRTVQIPASNQTAYLVDMWGNRQTISARDGLFIVELPAAPCHQSAGDYCIIGGPAYYLVQTASSQPVAQPTIPQISQITPSPTTQPAGSPISQPTDFPTSPSTNPPTTSLTATFTPTMTPLKTASRMPTGTPSPTRTLSSTHTPFPTQPPTFTFTPAPTLTTFPTEIISTSITLLTNTPTLSFKPGPVNQLTASSGALTNMLSVFLFVIVFAALLAGWILFRSRA